MDAKCVYYICPSCFKVCENAQESHTHRMIVCDVGEPGDERRKPIVDQFGNLASRAPRWYLEAMGWIAVE